MRGSCAACFRLYRVNGALCTLFGLGFERPFRRRLGSPPPWVRSPLCRGDDRLLFNPELAEIGVNFECSEDWSDIPFLKI